ncbi:hypothetical protein ACFQ3B_08555 [Stackebrandtia endophytica]|uniref:hypothetical protein n=1 Tax=Stackebrandtia endophytica TaxID=1496996 RepID=UPI0011507C7A|nr:hypothetical protein [Stackebrandtia endophytica]
MTDSSAIEVAPIMKELGRLYSFRSGGIDSMSDSIAGEAGKAVRQSIPEAPSWLAAVVEEAVRLGYDAAAADVRNGQLRDLGYDHREV